MAWLPPLDSAQNVALKSDAAIGINFRKPWKGIGFDFDAPESELAATTTPPYFLPATLSSSNLPFGKSAAWASLVLSQNSKINSIHITIDSIITPIFERCLLPYSTTTRFILG